METRQKVVLYGSSLMLAGLQASLKTRPDFEVIALDELASQTELRAANPGVVIFDLGAIPPEQLRKKMQGLPEVLLIGLDAESPAVLLTGQAASAISFEQLMRIVHSQTAH